ncbi:ATP-dependent zinc protease family protein [Roseivirga misakiensis]|uniref:ATP-dependent zinc protease n=1 Tax=Roseivirga misakiensis TaxID=1563681 RepID=A0A1E5T5L9_9BACT|nr:RimK/LysX family protein [Roseivirga misakiensis]OEK06638.1 ATP-dependent zinc protease [Roseivirga misakiensis]
MSKKLKTIGRSDIVDLPDLNLSDIKAKVDTGAYTSSINCSRVKLKEVDGIKTLSFYIPGSRIHEKKARKFTTTQFQKRKIRSSNGMTESRYVIKTRLIIFGKERKLELSLADRSKMKFPILLGRKFLTDRFIVDVSVKDISYNLKIGS